MNDLTRIFAIAAATTALSITGCGEQNNKPAPTGTGQAATSGDHDHDDHDGHDHDHDHGDAVSLGTTTVGPYEVECWQAHGEAEPGKELFITVKLPFTDNGQTIVRVWIGGENRLASMVARADYAASHDDYDAHAEAPDPLPENARWWIEIERPDGTRHLGSIQLL